MSAYLTPTLLLVLIQFQHYIYCFTEDIEKATYSPKEPTGFKK